jgi:hypothetical protein
LENVSVGKGSTLAIVSMLGESLEVEYAAAWDGAVQFIGSVSKGEFQ